MPVSPLHDPLASLVARALARVERTAPALAADASLRARVAAVALASDFAIDTLVSQPDLLERLDGDPLPPPPADTATGCSSSRWSKIEKSCTARSLITLTSRWKRPRFTRVES